MSYDPPASTPIPANIERPDKILAGLTARQAAIFTVAALLLWAAFDATRHLVAPPVFAVLAAPAAVAAVVLVTGQRDGLTLDRLLAAAWRHARSPRRLVTAPGSIPAPPAWTSQQLARPRGGPPAPLDPLYRAVTSDGVIGLGDGGAAVAAAVSTVNLALRTPAEQDTLTAAYGRWLNSLTGPVQILIRAGHADLTAAVADLEDTAPALPDPDLEAAALDHAAFLSDLAAGRDLLARQVLLVTREPRRTGPGAARAGEQRPAGRAAHRRGRPAAFRGRPDRQRAGRRAGHRAAHRRRRPRRRHPRQPARRPRPGRHQPRDPAMTRILRRRTRRAPDDTAADPVPGPPDVQVGARHLRIGDDYTATLAVTGYPAEVAPGWLEPLLSYPGRLDVALHIDPVPPAVAAAGCAGSGPGWNPGAGPGRTAGSSMTLTPKPPQMTRGNWRTD